SKRDWSSDVCSSDLRGPQGAEQQAGLRRVHARDGADAFEGQVELGQVAAAQLEHQVPGAGGGVELLDLGVAADLVDDVVIAAGVGRDPDGAALRELVDVAADPVREAPAHARVDEAGESRGDRGGGEPPPPHPPRHRGAAVRAQQGDEAVVQSVEHTVSLTPPSNVREDPPFCPQLVDCGTASPTSTFSLGPGEGVISGGSPAESVEEAKCSTCPCCRHSWWRSP